MSEARRFLAFSVDQDSGASHQQHKHPAGAMMLGVVGSDEASKNGGHFECTDRANVRLKCDKSFSSIHP